MSVVETETSEAPGASELVSWDAVDSVFWGEVVGVAPALAYARLVGAELFGELVDRLARVEEWDPVYAAMVQAEALGFVWFCAQNPDAPGTPSPIVDKGWHNAMLHSAEYEALCERLGRFVDHTPRPFGPSASRSVRVGQTVAAMRTAGYPVRAELWPTPEPGSDPDDGCQCWLAADEVVDVVGAVPALPYTHLVGDELFAQLVDRLARVEEWDREYAAVVQDEALAFVQYCAEYPDGPCTPSPIVDKGWHNAMLHSRYYRELCEQLGLFVHHAPRPGGRAASRSGRIGLTVAAMQTAGYEVRTDLWSTPNPGSHVEDDCCCKDNVHD